MSTDRRARLDLNDVASTLAVCQAVAKTTGVKIRPTKGTHTAHTDMVTKDVIVEPLNAYWGESRIKRWEGQVYHEVGHHAPEVADLMPMMAKYRCTFNSTLGGVINCIEDVRNEYNKYGYWPGRDDALSYNTGVNVYRGIKEWEGAKASGMPIEPKSQWVGDVLNFMYQYRQTWQPDVAIPAMEYEKYCKANYSHLMHDLENLTTAEDVYALAMKLLQDSDMTPEEQQEVMEEAEQKFNEKGKPEKGSGGGASEGEGADGESDSSDSEGSAGKEKGKEGKPEYASFSYKDLMDSDPSESGYATHDSKQKIKYDHEPKRNYTPHTKMEVSKAEGLGHKDLTFISRVTSLYEQGGNLVYAARRLFQSRTQRLVTHNNKSGRLDQRDLYRIPNGELDVFKRKEHAIDPKGTALFILTDASGSMKGVKSKVTAAAVALLNDAIQPLGVPTKIAAFTETGRTGCRHYIVKEFNERKKADAIINAYGYIDGRMSMNADGESIMWALAELRKRPEPRKILLVLSDGEPASDNIGDCYTYTQDVVKHASSLVECYGIGIVSNAVSRIYPEYTVLKDPSQLEACLLEVIKQKIFT